MGRRLLALLLSATALAAATGCGTDDRKAVRGTVRDMVVAVVNERDAKVCSLLTDRARTSFVSFSRRYWKMWDSGKIEPRPQGLPPEPRTCEQARVVMDPFRWGTPPHPEQLAHDPELLSGLDGARIAIDGDRATVTRFKLPLARRPLRLVRTSAGWRFAQVPFNVF